MVRLHRPPRSEDPHAPPLTWYEVPVRVFAPSGEQARTLVYRPLYAAAISGEIAEFGVGIATQAPIPAKPQKETADASGSDETLHL